MNKFVAFICVVLLSVLITGCKGCHQVPPSDVKEGWGETYQKEKSDTLKPYKIVTPGKDRKEKKEERARGHGSSSDSGSYSSSRDEEDYDNMRGFDPASEDDMDDNGMSRYMDNNDEEGWE